MKEEELKEWNIIDDFNKFILKWCKENYIGHLLDDDENDGEDFRDKLRKIQEGRQSKLKDELEFLKKWFKKELSESDAYENEKGEIRTTFGGIFYDNDLVECKQWEIIQKRIKQISKELAGVKGE